MISRRLADDALGEFWPRLRHVLDEADRRLEREAILRAWPGITRRRRR